MVEPRSSTAGNGSSDTATLHKMFPGSPVYTGEMTDDTVTETYTSLLDGINVDNGTFGSVNMDYADAPDLREVEVGGGGLPGSPYAPNIASPPEGMNPADIPAAGVEATQAAKGSGSPFIGNGLTSPKDTSATISKQKIGSLQKGKSTPVGG